MSHLPYHSTGALVGESGGVENINFRWAVSANRTDIDYQVVQALLGPTLNDEPSQHPRIADKVQQMGM